MQNSRHDLLYTQWCERPNCSTLQLSIREFKLYPYNQLAWSPEQCILHCFSPEPPGVPSSYHSPTSNAELFAVDWVVNAHGQDVLTLSCPSGPGAIFFSFLLTASIFSSTASAVYQRDLGRLNVGKEAGGSQPALKRALSFQAPSSLALSPFCKNLWCPYHLQEKLWCLSLKSKSGGR